jgi:hypothetical protein
MASGMRPLLSTMPQPSDMAAWSAFSVRGDNLAANLANNIEHFIVTVHCVVEVGWREIELARIGIVAFFQLNNALHQRVVQMEFEFGGVCIKISHNCLIYLEFCL